MSNLFFLLFFVISSRKKRIAAGILKKKTKGEIPMMDMNLEQFRSNVAKEQVSLVEFWAPWCVYCRRIAPAMEKVAAQEQIEVIPTLVLYRGGKALGSIVAPESKARIEEFVRETLA